MDIVSKLDVVVNKAEVCEKKAADQHIGFLKTCSAKSRLTSRYTTRLQNTDAPRITRLVRDTDADVVSIDVEDFAPDFEKEDLVQLEL